MYKDHNEYPEIRSETTSRYYNLYVAKLPCLKRDITIHDIKRNPFYITHAIDPSSELEIAALSENFAVSHFLPYAKPETQLFMVSKSAHSIKHVINQTPEAQLEAYKKSPSVFPYLKNPPKDLIMTAISDQASYIKFIENPTEDMKWLALHNSPNSIRHIRDRTDEMIIYSLSKNINLATAIYPMSADIVKYIFENREKMSESKWKHVIRRIYKYTDDDSIRVFLKLQHGDLIK